ncbi:MAG: VanZ family protein [Ignavibacteriae bacterium]|nr:VanZ family protein [Ignavibacteriota bacterium]
MTVSRPFLKYHLPAVVWCASIFVLSAIPGAAAIRIPPGVDKIIHGIIYFVLCLLVWRAFYYQSGYPTLQKRALLSAFLFTVIYGGLDEFHQIYVPGRTPDIMDVVADGTAALLCVLVLMWWLRKRKRVSEE